MPLIKISHLDSIDSDIELPASKYHANRALIISSLADGKSSIHDLPENADISEAIHALENMGIRIWKQGRMTYLEGGRLRPGKVRIAASGTLLRFLCGVAATLPGKTEFSLGDRLSQRPILPLLESLKRLGADYTLKPLSVKGPIKGGKTEISGEISSQFISSLLMAAPYAEQEVILRLKGKLASKNYLDMTIDMMDQAGITVKKKSNTFTVCQGSYLPKEYWLPTDVTLANYFFALCPVSGKVRIRDLDNSGESGFLDILKKAGYEIRRGKLYTEVTCKGIKPVEVDMSSLPDAVPALAAIACFAKGRTIIKNIGHLRHKESDRLSDLVTELNKTGIIAKAQDSSIIIEGGFPSPAILDSHDDHRLAMAFAIIGIKTGVKIKNPGCVEKSYPGFWDKLKEIGAKEEYA